MEQNGITTSAQLKALAYKELEVPADVAGAAGIKVLIRCLPRLAIEQLRAGKDRAEQEIEVARVGLLEPRVRFDPMSEDDGSPLWDELPMALRNYIATSILGITYQGMPEVVRWLKPFLGKIQVDDEVASAGAPDAEGVSAPASTE